MNPQAITTEDPASDIRNEIATRSGVAEPAGKIWFHKTAAAVIDAERCVGCGGCLAACPSRSISIGTDGRPTLTKMCTGCSACWDYCPLGGLRAERLTRADAAPDGGDLGPVLAAYSARAGQRSGGAQDGGVVTGLLAALIDAGHVDGALVTRRRDTFHGEPFIATSAEEVREAAGSVYHQSHPLDLLARPLPPGVERIAMVGTPCQLSVLRALQRFPWRYRRSAAGAVRLAIGLFCTRSFDPVRLMRTLLGAGVDVSRVARLDVRDGQLVLTGHEGEEISRGPVGEFRESSLGGCDECADFAGLAADLAVGNVGSEPGSSTVLVRTEAGAKAWEAAAGNIHAEPLAELEAVRRMAARNRARAERHLARGYDPSGPLRISYPEHLEAYSDTKRAPVAPPAHRSHHYDVSC